MARAAGAPLAEVLLMPEHLVGLLLGTEEDWPGAYEALVERVGRFSYGGETHELATERVMNEPFDLRYKPRYSLVIDRLAWWYYLPREWLKKIALMDDVYMLNNPFTFEEMASRYNAPFDLDEVAERVGYPLFMKPFDGGQWIGVTRIADAGDLHSAYDASGERMMHFQASVEGFDVFARSLSIGAETMVMKYDPSKPLHDRYSVAHDFLSSETGNEVVTISRLVNAFFRWEFNSCETLIKDGEVYPIDYANASPDVALTSLHYYFPWAMKALFRWTAFCTATGRPNRINQDTRRYFETGDRDDLSYEEKLTAYRELADDFFEIERYEEFCAEALPHLDEVLLEYVQSDDFDRLLLQTVQTTFPAHEHEHFVAHYRGLLDAWAKDQRVTA